MAITKQEFVDNVVKAHDELNDVANKLDSLLSEVPELGFEPAVVVSLNTQVNGIVYNIDNSIDRLFALKDYIVLLDSTVDPAGTNSDPAGNVNEQFAAGSEDVAAPVPAENNLISQPEAKPVVESPLVTEAAPVVEDNTVPTE